MTSNGEILHLSIIVFIVLIKGDGNKCIFAFKIQYYLLNTHIIIHKVKRSYFVSVVKGIYFIKRWNGNISNFPEKLRKKHSQFLVSEFTSWNVWGIATSSPKITIKCIHKKPNLFSSWVLAS